MKRAAALISGLLVGALVLAACGGGTAATPTAKPRATNTPVPTTAAPTAAPTAVPTAAPTAAQPTSEAERLEISVNGDTLTFDTAKLSSGAGSQVVLTFSNVSTINQHNLVIVQAGTKDDVAVRGTLHPTTDWVQPDDPDVLANTKLLNAGATGEVSFTAPPAGTYQFVCTFPGHNATMFGDFEVTG